MDSQADSAIIGGTEYNDTNSPKLSTLIEHYFQKFEDLDMTIEEGNNAKIADTSSGNIEYEGSGQVVTFLHVSENEVEVSFD